MTEAEFEATVGRIERDYEERGADLTDVYAIVNWARSSRQLLAKAAWMLTEIADQGFLPSESDLEDDCPDNGDR